MSGQKNPNISDAVYQTNKLSCGMEKREMLCRNWPRWTAKTTIQDHVAMIMIQSHKPQHPPQFNALC